MRRLVAVFIVLACALAGGSAVLAAEFGANDDTARYQADGGESLYAAMAGLGLRQSVIGVRWQPSDPFTIPFAEQLDRVIPVATKHGVRVVLALYPYPPRELEVGFGSPPAFASWAAAVARRYPQVRQLIVGNEPNQPAFWRPQFSRRDRRNVSAATFGAYLAAAYDAIKGVDPTLRVIGVGLSPRGNDRPAARSNVSTSPVRFLAALGRWYRASGRSQPLMDALSFHPYPARATDPLARGYEWPNAGFVDLARVKQAVWDAFAGTPQPTTVDGLKLYLDEVGWQVDTSFLDGYDNVENVPVTDELTQALIYSDLVRRAQCDPDIAEVNVFGFYDDRNRLGFQAGLHRADGTPRPAAEAVRLAILEGSAACSPAAPWQPETGVLGASVPRVVAGARSIVVLAGAREGVAVTACTYAGDVPTPVAARLPARAGGVPARCARGTATPGRPARLLLPRTDATKAGGTVAVRVTAETNTARVASYTSRFR